MDSNYLDYWRNDCPKCPHCNNDVEDWWDGGITLDDGAVSEFECGRCKETFYIQTLIELKFSTAKTEEEARDI